MSEHLNFDMRNPHSRSIKEELYLILLVSVSCMLMSSGSAKATIQHEVQLSDGDVIALKYSIVFIIHGDGDYVYHDTSGNEYDADEETLAEAKKVALQNYNAEVFIFHQKPRRHFLLFFPLRDGDFYYYRNGSLIANESYWRDQEKSNFDNEVGLYHHYRIDHKSKKVNIFLYFGHEIPEFNGTGYDASYPDRTFSIHDLANGVKRFLSDSTKFDLMLLSTCFSGTPYTMNSLAPFARYIIASPDNLHLSYFDIHLLGRLDLIFLDNNIHAFAKRFAQEAFDRLSKDIQTAVSVAVYDIDLVQEYLHSVQSVYEQTLATMHAELHTAMRKMEHCDCVDLPAFALPTIKNGVDIFYRPARFGRLKQKLNHSGWECWRDIGS